MSGHSKWANIKHKKGKADAERGKVFTKIGREIAIAVRDGGSDPTVNGKLRDVIAKAKANNMPNENIKRSIAKAAGELGNVNYEEIQYEGYAPVASPLSFRPLRTIVTAPLPISATSSIRTAVLWVPMAAFLTCSIMLA